MAAELAPCPADGTLCTDKVFRVRQFGVDKSEEKHPLGPPAFLDMGFRAETQSRKT